MPSLDIVERHAIADMHINAAADTLTHPEVKRALGVHTKRLLDILDWLYVPNIRNGVYEAPRRFVDTPRMPLIVAMPGEQYQCKTKHMATMHPEQIENLPQALERFGLDYDSDRNIHELVNYVEAATQVRYGDIRQYGKEYLHRVNGRVTTSWGWLYDKDEDDSAWVATRPSIVINAAYPVGNGDILIHEGVHVDQAMDESLLYIHGKDERLRVELKPYHIGYEALKALYGYSVPHEYSYIAERETVRRLANGDGENAFDVTPKLKRLMRSENYDYSFRRIRAQGSANRKRNKHGRVGIKKR